MDAVAGAALVWRRLSAGAPGIHLGWARARSREPFSIFPGATSGAGPKWARRGVFALGAGRRARAIISAPRPNWAAGLYLCVCAWPAGWCRHKWLLAARAQYTKCRAGARALDGKLPLDWAKIQRAPNLRARPAHDSISF